MWLGPIFSIDMLTTARRARYYVLRGVYALALLVVLFCNYYDPFGRHTITIHEAASMATGFFQAFAVVQLLAVACLAPALAAGTVALERERRTIEYLFATDLSNAEIVLGRLCARMLLITSTILVGLPIMALAMLFGGIAGERMLIVFALTMSTALFVASLSIAVSVGTPKARDAVLRCYAILLALWIVPPVLTAVLSSRPWLQWLAVVPETLQPLSPFEALLRILSSGGINWSSIVQVLVAQAVAAAICIALAVTLVRRIHLRTAGAAASSSPSWMRAPLGRRRRAVSDRAMLWKEMFAPQSKVRLGIFGHISLALLTLIALGLSFYALKSVNQMTGYVSTGKWYLMQTGPFAVLIASFGGLAVSARAAASITGERERQCWDSLISSPIDETDIVWAKIWGSVYSARWLMALIAIMLGLGVLVDITLVLPVLFSLGTLFVVLSFGCALGVFFSTGGNSSLRAMGSTLGTLVFVGGGYLFCCVPMMFGPGGGREGEVVLALCIPFLLMFPLIASEQSFAAHASPEYIAYAIGMILYILATILLAGAAIGRVRPEGAPWGGERRKAEGGRRKTEG